MYGRHFGNIFIGVQVCLLPGTMKCPTLQLFQLLSQLSCMVAQLPPQSDAW